MSFVSYLLGSVMLFYNFSENIYCINIRYYIEFENEIKIIRQEVMKWLTIIFSRFKTKNSLAFSEKVKHHLRNSKTNGFKNDNQIIFERMWMVAWT